MWLFDNNHRNGLVVGLCASIALCLSTTHPAYSAWRYVRPFLRGGIASSPLLLYQGLRPCVYADDRLPQKKIGARTRMIDKTPSSREEISFSSHIIADADGLNAALKRLIAKKNLFTDEGQFYQEIANVIVASGRLDSIMLASFSFFDSKNEIQVERDPCSCCSNRVHVEMSKGPSCMTGELEEIVAGRSIALYNKIFIQKEGDVYKRIFDLVFIMAQQFRLHALLSDMAPMYAVKEADKVALFTLAEERYMLDLITTCIKSSYRMATSINHFQTKAYPRTIYFEEEQLTVKNFEHVVEAELNRENVYPSMPSRIKYVSQWLVELLCARGMNQEEARKKVSEHCRVLVITEGIRARINQPKEYSTTIELIQKKLLELAPTILTGKEKQIGLLAVF